jgi:D-alanyl-D-alanine carboxypeptidase
VAPDPPEEAVAAKHRGKKTHVAAKRPPEAGADDASKPAKHANAAAKTADKPATDAKPAKPKTVAKPAKPKPDAKSS